MVPFQTNTVPITTASDPATASGSSGDYSSGGRSSGGGSTTTTSPTGDGYVCTGATIGDTCQGSGLSDLQFHQIQDLLNQCQQRLRDNSGGTYEGPSVAVDGILSQPDAQSLAILSQYGVFFDIHPTPQWMADNAAGVIATLNQFLGRAPTAWNAGIFTRGATTGSRASVTQPGVVVDPGSSSYTCPDGSIVSDPSYCPTDSIPGGIPPTGTTPGTAPPITTTPPIVPMPISLSSPIKWGIVIAGVLAGVAAAAFLQHR